MKTSFSYLVDFHVRKLVHGSFYEEPANIESER